MNNAEKKIMNACSVERRDFTEKEKTYIKNHPELQNELLYWFESRISDGCWTAENLFFVKTFYSHKFFKSAEENPNGRITAAHVEKTVKKMQRQKLNESCQKSPVTNPPPLPKRHSQNLRKEKK